LLGNALGGIKKATAFFYKMCKIGCAGIYHRLPHEKLNFLSFPVLMIKGSIIIKKSQEDLPQAADCQIV
jgi:hypothetical protein